MIEIAVVLAVIMVLMAVLVAVFSRARENGRRSVCQSNIRQVTMAVQQYVQNNDARFPAREKYWLSLSPYLKNTQIFQCPTDSTPQGSDPNFYDFIDYDLNAEDLNMGVFPARVGVNEAALHKSSTTMVLRESQIYVGLAGITNTCGLSHWAETHSGGANYSFLDGHVKWLKPEEAAAIWCQNKSG